MMMVRLAIMGCFAGCLWAVQGCTKEEYRAKFGALPTYELHASGLHAKPVVENGFVKAEVTYLSPCPSGGSTFEAHHKDMRGTNIIMLSRNEPSCESPGLLNTTFTGVVSAKLKLPSKEDPRAMFGAALQAPAALFIAFPPDGEYELFKLDEVHSTGDEEVDDAEDEDEDTRYELNAFGRQLAGQAPSEPKEPPDHEKPSAAKIQEELDSQSEEDSQNHLMHCLAHPGEGCCSEMMIAALQKKLGAPVDESKEETQAASSNLTAKDATSDEPSLVAQAAFEHSASASSL